MTPESFHNLYDVATDSPPPTNLVPHAVAAGRRRLVRHRLAVTGVSVAALAVIAGSTYASTAAGGSSSPDSQVATQPGRVVLPFTDPDEAARQLAREVILDFSQQPNSTGNDLGELNGPELVASFATSHLHVALWVATSSTGKVCYATTDAWDGTGVPTRDELEYGCGGVGANNGEDAEPTQPDELSGFSNDNGEPYLVGISPYAEAVRVRVRGTGVDRTLPVRPDSLGYGAALPEANNAPELVLTFLDADGHPLGTKRLPASDPLMVGSVAERDRVFAQHCRELKVAVGYCSRWAEE